MEKKEGKLGEGDRADQSLVRNGSQGGTSHFRPPQKKKKTKKVRALQARSIDERLAEVRPHSKRTEEALARFVEGQKKRSR